MGEGGCQKFRKIADVVYGRPLSMGTLPFWLETMVMIEFDSHLPTHHLSLIFIEMKQKKLFGSFELKIEKENCFIPMKIRLKLCDYYGFEPKRECAYTYLCKTVYVHCNLNQ